MDAPEKEIAVKTHIAMNAHKLVPKFTKIYNSMCGRCRQMCLSNSSRPMSEYCQKCQNMMKKILDDYK